MYHGDIGTFGFADGHTESHKYRTPTLIQAGKAAAVGQPYTTGYIGQGFDQDYIHDNYRFPGWR
jgi:hypothetical protein